MVWRPPRFLPSTTTFLLGVESAEPHESKHVAKPVALADQVAERHQFEHDAGVDEQVGLAIGRRVDLGEHLEKERDLRPSFRDVFTIRHLGSAAVSRVTVGRHQVVPSDRSATVPQLNETRLNGIFWSVEGAGAEWPGSDLSILGILAFLTLTSFAFAAILRRADQRTTAARVVATGA